MVRPGEIQEHAAQRVAGIDQFERLYPQVETVDRDVDVIAAARRVQAAGDVRVAAGGRDLALQVEKQILDAAVIPGVPDRLEIEAVDRSEDRPGVGGSDDPLLGEHDRVRPVDREVVIEEEALRVGEAIREHVLLVSPGREFFRHRSLLRRWQAQEVGKQAIGTRRARRQLPEPRIGRVDVVSLADARIEHAAVARRLTRVVAFGERQVP